MTDQPADTSPSVAELRHSVRMRTRDHVDQYDPAVPIVGVVGGDVAALFEAIEDDDGLGITRALLGLSFTVDQDVPGSLSLARVVSSAWAYVYRLAASDDGIAAEIEHVPGRPASDIDEPGPESTEDHEARLAADEAADNAAALAAGFQATFAEAVADAQTQQMLSDLNLPDGDQRWLIRYQLAPDHPTHTEVTGRLRVYPPNPRTGLAAQVTDETGLVVFAMHVVSIRRVDDRPAAS